MPMRLLAFVLIVAAAFATEARAEIFKGFPDAIVCEFGKAPGEIPRKAVFYIDAQFDDGRVLYRSLRRAPDIEISKEGVVRARGHKDCDGHTIHQMRQKGRAFDF